MSSTVEGWHTSEFWQKVVFLCPLNYCKGFLIIHCPRTTISRKTCFQNLKSHFLKITIFDISTLNSCQMVIFVPRNFPGLNSIPTDWALYTQTYTWQKVKNSLHLHLSFFIPISCFIKAMKKWSMKSFDVSCKCQP